MMNDRLERVQLERSGDVPVQDEYRRKEKVK
jgi:hypothetical protein